MMVKGIFFCACFALISFLHSTLYRAVFWICTENSVDSLWMSSASESRPFLLLNKKTGSAQDDEREHSWDS